MLINIFIKKFNQAHSKKISGVTRDALDALKRYNWPGNIRELENVIEHAFVLESGQQITLGSLPETVLVAAGINLIESMDKIQSQSENLKNSSNGLSFGDLESELDLEDSDDDLDEDIDGHLLTDGALTNATLDFNAQKEEFEKQFIIKALKTFKGKINQTALHANIPKKTLLRKIEKYGIVAKEYAD